MEFGYILGGLFLFGLLLLSIILSIAAYLRSGDARSAREAGEKHAEELTTLRIRLAGVEARLKRMASGETPPGSGDSGPAPAAENLPPMPRPAAHPAGVAPPEPLARAAIPAEQVPPPSSSSVIAPVIPALVTPITETRPAAALQQSAIKPLQPPTPALPRPPIRPAVPPPTPAKSFSLEELLGGQVFMKLGIAIFILAMVFFLILEFKKMGPLGKVATGYAGAAVFFAAGFYFEARKKYQALGRSLLAGGWGIAYFVTFALHFIPAARIVESGELAVLLLLAVAAGTVGFSLRYRNEWTTAFAFLLIFLSLGLAAFEVEPLFNVTATAIAAAALAAIAWQRRWQFLYVLGNIHKVKDIKKTVTSLQRFSFLKNYKP